MVDTRNQWISELERLSAIIRVYNLNATLKDITYVDRPTSQPKIFHDADAFNVANSLPHNTIVTDAITVLQGRMPHPAIRSLLGELTFRKTSTRTARLSTGKSRSPKGRSPALM
jgi:hypothetical protein